jgi:hypothetical protein
MREGTPPLTIIQIKSSEPIPISLSGQPCNCSWSSRPNGIMELKFLNSSCPVHSAMFQECRAHVPSDTPEKVTVPKPRGRPRKD